jgi:hypothetical protein
VENQQRKPWVALNIIERGEGEAMKTYWSRVGRAFHNRDGSVNIYLDSVPLGGKIQIREDDRERKEERGALAEKAEA